MGQFADSVVEAIGACTRTLSGVESADAPLTSTRAATLGGLRAFGDRLALKARFHDPRVHARHRPAEAAMAGLFDAMEQARLDAIGARWLDGVRLNLLTHPGPEVDPVRWLTFEALCDLAAPPEQQAAIAAFRSALPSRLLDDLTRLSTRRDDQIRFAPEALRWALAARSSVPPSAEPQAGGLTVQLPQRVTVRSLPKRGNPGATAAPLEKRQTGTQDDEAAGAGAITQGSGTGTGYHAYTTAHDRVVSAAALADRAELADLHVKLAKELGSIRPVVARLAKRLLRVLMARQTRHWRFDLDEGVLDGSRLAALVASGGGARPFKEEGESPFPSTVVTLLIDHSGSMRGRPMLIAALTVEIFAQVLERCGVRCEVLGFTTRDWDGGEPAREWAANGYPEDPGRLNALQHIIIKSADVPWRRARPGLGLFLHNEMLRENIDGEAVSWAHARLLARGERRRILVVVSDGTPMDEATLAANGYEYLEGHLQKVVRDIETRSPVQLAAIGIGHDVSLFYQNATTIARIDHLGPALGTKLTGLLGETSAPRRRHHRDRRPGLAQ